MKAIVHIYISSVSLSSKATYVNLFVIIGNIKTRVNIETLAILILCGTRKNEGT